MEKMFSMPEDYNRSFIEGAEATWEDFYYLSSVTGTKRHGYVLLPKGYTKEKEYPLLFLLHGIGGDENEWKLAGPEFISGNLMQEGKTEDMIIVLVNVRARKNDAGNPPDIFTKKHYEAFDAFREELLDDVLPYVKENYSIKEGRENLAIAGLSMGGRESLYIGMTRQGVFGSIGAFCPAYGLLPYTNNEVYEEGLLGVDGFALLPEWKENTKIIITAGKDDVIVRNEPEKYHVSLEGNGVKHEYHLLEGGHDFDVWAKSLYYFLQRIF